MNTIVFDSEWSAGKESTCNVGDLGSIPGLGRSSGEGKGYPLQYSGLENSMDYIVHGISKSQTGLRNFHFHPIFWASQVVLLVKNPPVNARNIRDKRSGFDSWVRKILWRRAWQPSPVFLSGESPWIEELNGLQTMGLLKVRHDLATKQQQQSFRSGQVSRSVVSDSLQPHESQHTRPPCPSSTPGVYSNSCPLSR